MTKAKLLGLILTTLVAAVGVVLLAPPESTAQGCALCYQSAAASGPRMIQALRDGIFVLAIPSAFVCVAITWLTWRRRNLHNS
jgi:hypothetical protein